MFFAWLLSARSLLSRQVNMCNKYTARWGSFEHAQLITGIKQIIQQMSNSFMIDVE